MGEIFYKNNKIEYVLVREKIKNLYIQIKNGKVIVKAPLRLSDKKIEDFINKKAKWIYDNLQKEKLKKQNQKDITSEDLNKLVKYVEKYILKYQKILKVSPNQVRIRDINYAWGSCSSKKNITINRKMANKTEKEIEYVVLHEMCHLLQMNHSNKFWNLVELNMPDYKKYRKMLKE